MRSEKKNTAYLCFVIGWILQALSRFLSRISEAGETLGWIGFFIGLIVLVWGCIVYAEAKGYSRWLGLLGVLSCLGVLILIAIPEKQRRRR